MEAGARLCFWKLWHLHFELWGGNKNDIYHSVHLQLICSLRVGVHMVDWMLYRKIRRMILLQTIYFYFSWWMNTSSLISVVHQSRATVVHVVHDNKAEWMQSDAKILEATRFFYLFFAPKTAELADIGSGGGVGWIRKKNTHQRTFAI